jgi:hypothetical protein
VAHRHPRTLDGFLVALTAIVLATLPLYGRAIGVFGIVGLLALWVDASRRRASGMIVGAIAAAMVVAVELERRRLA